MKLRRPAAPLNAFVESIWLAPAQPALTPADLALPTATVELVIDIDDDRVSLLAHDDLRRPVTLRGPVLCGVHTRPFGIVNEPRATLGVHFRPGGAAAILPVPLSELENRHVELSDVAGAAWTAQLRDALDLVAHDDERLLSTMECFLARAIRRNVHPVVTTALASLDGCCRGDIRSLVEASGYSHRRFNELFRTAVGLTPKRYTSVARFQQALREIERTSTVDWCDVVSACGYYDQAHLIHEFKRHAELTPSQYLALRGERPNHPALPT